MGIAKLHSMGLMTDEEYEIDGAFGLYLKTHYPDVYKGYLSWARTVVAWIEKNPKAPKLSFISEDRMQKIAIDWSKGYIVPGTHEMSYLLGRHNDSTIAGRFIWFGFRTFCGAIGKYQRTNGITKKRFLSKTKSYILLATMWIAKTIVSILKRK